MDTGINVETQTIPTLPSRSIPQTVAFYRQLGFVGDAHPHDAGYAILRRGDVELHFFAHRTWIRPAVMRAVTSG